MSDSDNSYYYGHELGDEMSLYGAGDLVEGGNVSVDRATSVDSDAVPHNYEEPDNIHGASARAVRRIGHSVIPAHYSGHQHTRNLREASSDIDDDEVGEAYPDPELYSSDDSAGSLIDFVDDDQSGMAPRANSPRSSHYDTDPGTEVAMDYHSDYEGGGFSPYESGIDRRVERTDSTDSTQDDSDDEFEGSRARRQRLEAPSIESDEDTEILAMQERIQARRSAASTNGSIPRNTMTRFRHQATPLYQGSTYHGRSQQAPIEIGSDSDVSVPIPRTRSYRHIVDPESSDDNDAAESDGHRSSSSGTVRRRSSDVSSTANSTMRNNKISRRASPIILDSSPVRGCFREDNWTVKSPPPGRSSPRLVRQTTRGASTSSSPNTSPSITSPQSPRSASRGRISNPGQSPLYHLHHRLMTSPTVPRHASSNRYISSRGRASGPVAPFSPRRALGSAASRRSSESDEARAAAKAERRRIKQERRQRNRIVSNAVPERVQGLASVV
ncbi:hypothetical protein G7Y79_00028g061490 [Physcia stellaris]|nr:hypothetical protein G7Y79_00028g061490 [Physcia stellaris]